MGLLQEILGTLFILSGVIFMMIAAIGILRLPDFYIRMSAITKAGTMGVGLIVFGIAVYFNDLLISAKAFVIVSFMLLTAPVAAHIIARAAYRQGIPLWGRNLVDELDVLIKKRDNCEEIIASEPDNLKVKLEILDYYTALPPILGGSLRKAVLIASDIKEADPAQGHRALGMLYAKDKEYRLAEQEYRSAIEKSHGRISYWYELGLFYRRIEWYDHAFDVFDQIIKDNPGEKKVYYETGKTSALSGQKPDLGEESLKRYINSHPVPDKHSLSKAFFYLGLIFFKRRDFDRAGENFQKSLEYDKGLTDSGYYLRRMRRK
jgi:multicomponent Na+:H+ antiporter subunit G